MWWVIHRFEELICLLNIDENEWEFTMRLGGLHSVWESAGPYEERFLLGSIVNQFCLKVSADRTSMVVQSIFQ